MNCCARPAISTTTAITGVRSSCRPKPSGPAHHLFSTKNGSPLPSPKISRAKPSGPAVPIGSSSCQHQPWNVDGLPWSGQCHTCSMAPDVRAHSPCARRTQQLHTCEQVIFICSLVSHSFKKSIMTWYRMDRQPEGGYLVVEGAEHFNCRRNEQPRLYTACVQKAGRGKLAAYWRRCWGR